MKKRILKVFFVLILGMAGGVFADQILTPYLIKKLILRPTQTQNIYITEEKKSFIQENTALKESIEKVEKAIVAVETKTKKGEILEGSGIIVTSDGLIVTLAELMPETSKSRLFINNEEVFFDILKKDSKGNLVLLKATKGNLPTVSFANLEKIKSGERVFLLGTIFQKESIKKAVNEGIIRYFDEDLIYTNIFDDVILRGSALFDIEGGLLGLNKIDKEGKVYAIPVSKIRTFIGI